MKGKKVLEGVPALSKKLFKNRIEICFALILLILSVLIINPDIKVLKKQVLLKSETSLGHSGTINNVKFDSFKLKINNNYSKEELSHIKKVEIDLIDDKNYDYLNYMTNLETLIIYDYSTKPVLNNIDGKNFKNQMNIEIYRRDYAQSFTKEKFGFLSDIPYINNLKIGEPLKLGSITNNKLINVIKTSIILQNYKSISYNIESKFLESLKNVHNLNLGIDEYFRYQYNDLSFLDTLYLNGGAYDVAIYFSNNDLQQLKESGVVVRTNNMEELIEVNNKIDEIISSFNLSKKSTNEVKLDTVLGYVLNNAKYDEELAKVNDVTYYNIGKFYKDGFLNGFFNNDSQICGNYASITNALLTRLGIESYLIDSGEHIWNVVKMNNKYYYLDATWMDGDTTVDYKTDEVLTAQEVFSNNKYNNLRTRFEWYLLEIEDVDNYNLSLHNPTAIPVDIINEVGDIKLSDMKVVMERPFLNIIKVVLCFITILLALFDVIGLIRYNKQIKIQIKYITTKENEIPNAALAY